MSAFSWPKTPNAASFRLTTTWYGLIPSAHEVLDCLGCMSASFVSAGPLPSTRPPAEARAFRSSFHFIERRKPRGSRHEKTPDPACRRPYGHAHRTSRIPRAPPEPRGRGRGSEWPGGRLAFCLTAPRYRRHGCGHASFERRRSDKGVAEGVAVDCRCHPQYALRRSLRNALAASRGPRLSLEGFGSPGPCADNRSGFPGQIVLQSRYPPPSCRRPHPRSAPERCRGFL